MDIFFEVRRSRLKRKTSTSELIDWLKLLMADDIPADILKDKDVKTSYAGHCSKMSRTCTFSKSGIHASGKSLMLINFFMTLKHERLPVSFTELFALLECLKQNIAFGDVDEFYHVARLCHSQR